MLAAVDLLLARDSGVWDLFPLAVHAEGLVFVFVVLSAQETAVFVAVRNKARLIAQRLNERLSSTFGTLPNWKKRQSYYFDKNFFLSPVRFLPTYFPNMDLGKPRNLEK